MNELMNLPPLGFFFIVKHALVDSIPTVFFALQKDGTADTVSFQVESQAAGLDIPALNKILEALVENWCKQHSVGAAPKVEEFTTSISAQPTSTRGEMV
jgi:hypothetical protein